MAIWLVRAGRKGEHQNFALDNGVVVIGWDGVHDLSQFETRGAIEVACRDTYAHAKPKTITNWVGQLWAFANRIKVGDLVGLPLKGQNAIAFGRVTDTYRYRPDNPAGANDTAVEASMVATAIIDLMASRDEWTGAMTKLLTELNNLVDDAIIRRKGWPADGARLGRELRRTAPNLRASGIDIQFDTPSRRSMTVRKVLHSTDIADMPSQTDSDTTTEGVDVHDGNVGSYSATPITVTASGRGRPGTKQL